jgi:hypothetical protein
MILEVGLTLHHVRTRLPTDIRVTDVEHPLAGRVLAARHVYRRYGQIWVVAELPDGGVTSIPAESTNVAEAAPVVTAFATATTLSVAGVRRLRALLAAQLKLLGEDPSVGAGRVKR